MLRILIVLGTRPETIKLAPVINELRYASSDIDIKTCVTGQHIEMVEPLFRLFDINPTYNLNIMRANQSLEHITINILSEISSIVKKEATECIIVQGDTTSAMASSLAGFYNRVKVAHVEAGLRTWNKNEPYPEEVNRRIIDSLSDLCFAHTEQARQNLLREGVEDKNIWVTGNTVIDALLEVASREFDSRGTIFDRLPVDGRKLILITAHRRENFGEPINNICRALKHLAQQYQDVYFVYPVHLNPNIQEPVYKHLSGMDNIFLVDPLEYGEFIQLMKRAHFIMTDSGGLQEEAPSLNKPVLVLRDVTERPEAVETGAIEIVGTEVVRITERFNRLMKDDGHYRRMAQAANPYGDGNASKRIVEAILERA